jgi:hypothetical protein
MAHAAHAGLYRHEIHAEIARLQSLINEAGRAAQTIGRRT